MSTTTPMTARPRGTTRATSAAMARTALRGAPSAFLDGVADEVGEYGADQRHANDDPTRLSEKPAGHVKCVVVRFDSGVGQIGHGSGPAGRGGVAKREHGDGGQKRVGDHRRDECREHDLERLANGEAKFRG